MIREYSKKERALLKMLSDKDKEITKLKEENKLLKEEYGESNTRNINSYNTNHITNNIDLNIYRAENLGYIMYDLLKKADTPLFENIPPLVGLIHFNPKRKTDA